MAALTLLPDVAPPGPLDDPLILFAIAAFGLTVVMLVWSRRRRSRPSRE
jgi:hypothetical protein